MVVLLVRTCAGAFDDSGRVPYVRFGCVLVVDLVFCLLHETASLSCLGFRTRELTAREVLSLCLAVLLRLVRVPCPDALLNLWFEVDIDYVDPLVSLETRPRDLLTVLCWTRFWARILGRCLSRF